MVSARLPESVSAEPQVSQFSSCRSLVAWGLSFALHSLMLSCLVLTMRVAPNSTTAEIMRPGGIVLTQDIQGERQYFEQTDMIEIESDTSVQTLRSILPAADQMPLDLAGVLPSDREVMLPSEQTGSFGARDMTSGGQPSRSIDGNVETSVFGVSGTGSKFVYVFDRSGSMEGHGGRPLAAAKSELLTSLRDLGRTHQFQIIFYNERPRVFNPTGGVPRLVWGDDLGKSAADQFVRGMVADGGTRHMGALKMALGMRPDVIFFLTDADEPHITSSELDQIRRWNRNTMINAIQFGFGPQRRSENFLVRLARQNGGQHIYVDVSGLSRFE